MFLKIIKSFPVLIGAYTLVSNGYNNLYDAYNHFYRIPIRFPKTYGDQQHVIITGATQGLGRALARELADKKIPIILISKNEDSLKEVKKELEKEFSSKIEIIPFDFENCSLTDYDNLFSQLNNYDISGLMNNMNYFLKKDFSKTTSEEILKMIQLTIIPNLMLTKYASDRFRIRNSPYKSFISTTSSAFELF